LLFLGVAAAGATGCSAGYKFEDAHPKDKNGKPVAPGIYECVNPTFNAKAHVNTKDLMIWVGTDDPRMDAINLDNGQKFSIYDHDGWTCDWSHPR
jgi:hypothetical protein